ncbi:MAG: response regulator transcription factor [Bacillota bacterium]
MIDANSPSSVQKILIVDDDAVFRDRLLRALQARGYQALGAATAAEGYQRAQAVRPQRVVVDLRMPGGSGLDLVRDLTTLDPNVQIVVLTGYGSIATAVEAIRRGAVDYLTKPADTEQILAAFDRIGSGQAVARSVAATDSLPSLARVEWEHIQRTLADCGGNISEAARKLSIHRRSLQRKLGKLPPLA